MAKKQTDEITQLTMKLNEELNKIHAEAAQAIQDTRNGSVEAKCDEIANKAKRQAEALQSDFSSKVQVIKDVRIKQASRDAENTAKAAGKAVKNTLQSVHHATKSHVLFSGVQGFMKGLGIKK